MKKKGFKNLATKKQLNFFEGKNQLQITNRIGRAQAHWLDPENAVNGLNFYNDIEYKIFSEIPKRDGKKIVPEWFMDTLRSQHIPYNFFIPFRSEHELSVKVLNQLLFINPEVTPNEKIKTIQLIAIEYPSAKDNPLKDRTSFDAFIEYTNENQEKGIIGIEVKYTEGGYSANKKEKESIKNDESVYDEISNLSGLYCCNNSVELKKNENRQIWRNHLLAFSYAKERGIKHFKSVTLYPKGNQHFVKAFDQYQKYLTDYGKKTISGITYEKFFEALTKFANTDKQKNWNDYLKNRYLV
jgi:hypothetical protein